MLGYLTRRFSRSASKRLGDAGILGHTVLARQFARTRRQLLDGLPQHGDLVLLAGGVVDQALHGLRHRVVALRDAVGREAHPGRGLFTRGVDLGLDDACRIAHRGGARRHRLHDHGARADTRPVAHHKTAQHLRVGTDDHALAQRGMAFGALGQRGAAQRHALVDGAVVADLGGFAHHHTHAMVDEDPAADGGAGMDLDAREKTRHLGGEAPQPVQVHAPEGMGPAVHDDGMETRITGHHLPGGPRGGVTLEDAGDVFSGAFEHGGRSVCLHTDLCRPGCARLRVAAAPPRQWPAPCPAGCEPPRPAPGRD